MATKYKNLKSVAHNLGHSFLSDMNAVGEGSEYVIVPRRLFRAAAAERIPQVRIDFVQQQIEPAAACIPELVEATHVYARWLPRLLESQSIAADAVHEATLTLDFDYLRSRRATYDPEEIIQEFRCTVALRDDRGTEHVGEPSNWWRA
jgi:hypothetical protein